MAKTMYKTIKITEEQHQFLKDRMPENYSSFGEFIYLVLEIGMKKFFEDYQGSVQEHNQNFVKQCDQKLSDISIKIDQICNRFEIEKNENKKVANKDSVSQKNESIVEQQLKELPEYFFYDPMPLSDDTGDFLFERESMFLFDQDGYWLEIPKDTYSFRLPYQDISAAIDIKQREITFYLTEKTIREPMRLTSLLDNKIYVEIEMGKIIKGR